MKLSVGNLSFETSGESLRQHFTRAGAVGTATVVEERATGRSRGFGLVGMSTEEEGEAAIARFEGHDLGGRELTAGVAKPREGRKGGRGDKDRGGRAWRRRRGARLTDTERRRRHPYACALLAAFLPGFVPMWLKAPKCGGSLAGAEQQLSLARMQNNLAL